MENITSQEEEDVASKKTLDEEEKLALVDLLQHMRNMAKEEKFLKWSADGQALLFTPKAQNNMGDCWAPYSLKDVVDVLAKHGFIATEGKLVHPLFRRQWVTEPDPKGFHGRYARYRARWEAELLVPLLFKLVDDVNVKAFQWTDDGLAFVIDPELFETTVPFLGDSRFGTSWKKGPLKEYLKIRSFTFTRIDSGKTKVEHPDFRRGNLYRAHTIKIKYKRKSKMAKQKKRKAARTAFTKPYARIQPIDTVTNNKALYSLEEGGIHSQPIESIRLVYGLLYTRVMELRAAFAVEIIAERYHTVNWKDVLPYYIKSYLPFKTWYCFETKVDTEDYQSSFMQKFLENVCNLTKEQVLETLHVFLRYVPRTTWSCSCITCIYYQRIEQTVRILSKTSEHATITRHFLKYACPYISDNIPQPSAECFCTWDRLCTTVDSVDFHSSSMNKVMLDILGLEKSAIQTYVSALCHAVTFLHKHIS